MNLPLRLMKNLAGWPLSRDQKRLARDRDGWSEAKFVQHFAQAGVSQQIASAVWHRLQPEIMAEGFTPAPDDDLGAVFKIAEEELDELALALLETCNCRVPTAKETESMPPVRTVSDLVHFLSGLKA